MEHTPLLSAQHGPDKCSVRTVLHEIVWLIASSWPTVTAYFLQVSLQIAPIVCLGHLVGAQQQQQQLLDNMFIHF